ncbi:hypothetical protein V6N12_051261 [Hibiscus sabdariffa]|uniref:Uncharacterized protein n=1 Tax=Hibiscus sabdariffa TaxID=183260 RepID=A0ABR2GEX8_9ROSI
MDGVPMRIEARVLVGDHARLSLWLLAPAGTIGDAARCRMGKGPWGWLSRAAGNRHWVSPKWVCWDFNITGLQKDNVKG